MLSKMRTGVILMLRSLDAVEQCVAWFSLKAASSCREEYGILPVPVPDVFQSPALMSVHVCVHLPTHVTLCRVLTELVSKMKDMQMDKSELGCLRAIVLFNPGKSEAWGSPTWHAHPLGHGRSQAGERCQ